MVLNLLFSKILKKLSTREVVGFGETSSYDSTLNGKVLDLAIREGVDKLGTAVDQGCGKCNREAASRSTTNSLSHFNSKVD